MAKPKQNYTESRSALFPTYAPPETTFVRGEECYLYDQNDNAYLDFFAGIAVNSLGHCHPKLVSCLQQQSSQLWHVSNALRVPQGEQLAIELAKLTGLDKTFFTNSGTESVECGLKMMRRYHFDRGDTERQRVIGTNGAFHGRSYAAVCAAGNATHTKGFVFGDPGFDHVPFNDLGAIEAAISDKTAGIIVEPVQGEGGVCPADAKYLEGLRQLCDQHGILLMFDEVQCGIGRIGELFAFQHYNVQPDIIALAKGIGSGFPVGACVARSTIADGMVVGTHGSTYGGNPLAMAVASAVIAEISNAEFLLHVRSIAAEFRSGLEAMVERHPDLFESVRGLGLMLGIKCRQADDNGKIMLKAREEKLLLTKAGDNVVRILPPLIIQRSHVEEALDKLENAVQSHRNESVAA